jgi:uncharacterized protein YacL
MRLANRFRLLLVHDIAWFLFFFACCLSPARVAKFVAVVMLIIAERASGYAQRLIGTLTLRQMRIRATVTVIRYIAAVGCLIWADIVFADRVMWALSSVVIPVILVFCYTQVRLQLGREPLMRDNEPQPPNQPMKRTADRCAPHS